MNVSYQRQFDRIDAKLSDLLEELKDYSHEELNRQPAEGKWSAMQIMHHLIMAEGYGLSYIQKKLSSNYHLLKKAGLKASMRSLLLKSYLYAPFKFQAPEAVSTNKLPIESSFWEAAKKWKQQRSDLRAFLHTLPKDVFQKEVYKHPFAGRLTLKGLLDFYEAHFDRHRKQIKKALY